MYFEVQKYCRQARKKKDPSVNAGSEGILPALSPSTREDTKFKNLTSILLVFPSRDNIFKQKKNAKRKREIYKLLF